MFKSIEFNLKVYLIVLILSVILTTYLIISEKYIYASISLLITIYSLVNLFKNYQRFNTNMLFLLNALENGDYAFHFNENKMTKREKELNVIMNHIKSILVKAREGVIHNELYLSIIIESVPTGIIILNENNQIKTTNKAVSKLLGLPVFTHLSQLYVFDPDLPSLFCNLKANEKRQIKIPNEREETEISITASKVKIQQGEMKIITMSNINNELDAKEMESWIKLIRVMTHEIMNSIAPITSLTDTLLFSYKEIARNKDWENEEASELQQNTIEALDIINSTAKGLTTFVQSYRQFTGIPEPQLSKISIHALILQISKLEHCTSHNSKVNIYIDNENRDVVINADESQISQIVINLIKNAIESIRTDQAGEIRIGIDRTDGKIIVNIKNNGEPIPPEIVPDIFIPFFTTKDTGTGVGLSISRYIMRLHGGNLKHHSDGIWTEFSMIFPVSL